MPAIRTSVPAVHFALVSNAAITLNSSQSDSLQLALSGASNRIRTFLARADRRTALAGVFGSAGTAATTFNTKVTNLLSVMGSPGLGLQVELRSAADMNGAAVAYAPSSPSGGPRIYLNADLLSDGTSSDLISWLLLEAAGHNLDSRLNGVRDTAGDEGKAFAALLTGRTLSDSEMGVYGRDPAGGVVMVNGVAVAVECEANKAPTASATALNGSFSEGQGLANQGAAVKVFSNAAISVGAANETWQTIKALRLTVSGLRDGSDETITVDGTSIRFGANSSGTTASNGLSYSVTIANGVATLNLSKAAGIRAAAANALLNGLSYQNTNRDNPSAGARTITLTSLSDSGSTAVSGGTANGANNTSTPNLTSTITVVAVNDAPQLGSLASIALVDTSAADQFTATSGTLNATDPEGAALSYGLTDAIAANKSFDGLSYDLSKAGAYGTLYFNSSNGNYRFQPKSDWNLNALSTSGSESFNFTVSDGVNTTSTALLINFTGIQDAPEQYVVVDDGAPVLNAEAQVLWEQALTLASRYLSELLSDPDRDSIFNDVFGRAGTDATTFQANLQTLYTTIGGSGLRIDVDLRSDAELNGALAAYAAVGHTGIERIYVNGDKLNSGALDLTTTVSALLEEFGSAIDRRLNGNADSPGDEGQLFASEVTGVVLTADQRALIDAENDSATLTIEGVQVLVEQATSSISITTPSATLNSTSGSLSYTVTINATSSNGADILVAAYDSNSNLIGWQVVNRANNLISTSYAGSFDFADSVVSSVSTSTVTLRAWQGTAGSGYGTASDASPAITYGTGSISSGSTSGFTVNTTTAPKGNPGATGAISFTGTITVGSISQSATVSIDTIVPSAPVISTVTDNVTPITGAVNRGGSTNDTVLVLTGTAEANSTVTLYNGATNLGTATANGSGAWTFTTATLSNGTSYSFAATATDAAGNVSASSNTYSVTVDTAITPGTLSLTSYTDSGSSPSDFISTDKTFDLSLSGQESGATVVYQVSTNGGAWSTTTAAQSNLVDAAYQFRAVVTDAAGNTANTNTISVTVDNVAPTTGTLSLANYTDSGSSPSDFISTDKTFDLSLSGQESGATVVYQVSTNGGAWSTTTAAQSNLVDAAYQFRAVVTDTAGNTANTNTISVTVDNAINAPVISTVIDNVTPVTGIVNSGGSTNDTVLVLTGTAEANSTVTLYNGATNLGTATANGSGAWTFTTATLSNGTSYSFAATATDAAGNVSASSNTYSVTVDTDVPTTTATITDLDDNAIQITGSVASGGNTNDSTPTFSGTLSSALQADETLQIFNNSSTLLGTAVVTGTSWSYTPSSALANGNYVVTAVVSDTAGNLSSPSNTYSFTLNVTGPSVTSCTPTASSGKRSEMVVLTFDEDIYANGGTIVLQSNTTSIWTATLSTGQSSGTSTGVAWYIVGNQIYLDNTGGQYTSASNYNIDISAGAVVDAFGNQNLAVTSTNTTSSGTASGTGIYFIMTGGQDNSAPTFNVTSWIASATWTTTDFALAVGESIDLNLAFNETVYATSSSTSINFANGGFATYLSGNGSSTLKFRYTVNSSDTSVSDIVFATSNALSNGNIIDSSGVAITSGALNSVNPTGTAVVVDTAITSGTLSLTSYTDSGSSTSDFISTDKAFTLSLSGQESGATVVYQVSTNGGSSWSTTTAAQSNLVDGAYQFRANVTDAAGNTANTNTISVTVDNVAPTTGTLSLANYTDSGSSPSDFISTDKTFDLSLSGQESGATVVYQVSTNGGAWSTTTAAQSNLVDAAYQFRAVVTDTAGNTANTNTISVTVDNAINAPVISTVIDNVTPVTGIVNSGGSTNATVLVLTGTAEANSTVTLYNGATNLGTATANGSGAWTFTTATLSNGTSYSFAATATDAAGNVSASSNTYSVTVDTDVPTTTATITDLDDNAIQITGSVASGGNTNDSTPTFSGTLSSALQADETLQIFNNSSTLLGTAVVTGTSWSYTPSSALANGNYVVTAVVSDTAGNLSSPSNTYSFTLNVTGPSVTSCTPTASSGKRSEMVVLTFDEDIYANGGTIVLQSNTTSIWTATLSTGQSSGTSTGVAWYIVGNQIYLDNTGGQYTSASNYNIDISAGAVVDAFGNQNLAVTSTNTTSSGTASGTGIYFIMTGGQDNSAPTFNVTSWIASATWTTTDFALAVGESIDLNLAFNETVYATSSSTSINFANGGFATYLSGNGSSTLKFRYTVNSSDTSVSDIVFATSNALSNGNIIDSSGVAITSGALNSVNPTGTAVVVDTAITSGTLSLTSYTDSGSSTSDFISTDKAFTLSLSGQESGATVVYQVSTNGGSSWSTTTAAQSNLVDGAYQFRANVTDAAGNTANTNTISVTVDNVAPTVTDAAISITSIASGTSGAYKSGDTISVRWDNSATGNNNTDTIASATATVFGQSVTLTNAAGIWTGSIAVNSISATDTTSTSSVSVTAIDNAGNSTTTFDSTSITLDNVAPTVTDPAISITSTGSGTSGAYKSGDTISVRWDNSATGNNNTDTIASATATVFGQSVTLTNAAGIWTGSIAVNSISATDTTSTSSVSVTAIDNAGNSTTTFDSTSITLDNVAPTVTDAAISITSTGSGTSGAYKSGDTISVRWDNSATGNNNTDTIASATATVFGQSVTLTNAAGIWTGSIAVNSISATDTTSTSSLSVTAIDNAGNSTTTSDSTSITLDNVAPTVTDAAISITSTGSGTGGAYKSGDTISVRWDNSATGNNNTDTIASATATVFGQSVTLTNAAGIWTGSIAVNSISATDTTSTSSVSVTAIDNAGNSTTIFDSTSITLDNVAPTVTDAAISITSTGSGTGGAYKSGDTISVRWDNSATGNNNTDTIASATATVFGQSVTLTNAAGIWTGSIAVNSISATDTTSTSSVSVTAIDNAGNSTTTFDSTSITLDNVAPSVTDGNISISGGSGTGGAYKIGDTVTAVYDPASQGSELSSVTVDFSQFGGGAAIAAAAGTGANAGKWVATYQIISGSIDATSRNVSVTATDNAGNSTTTADATNASVDNIAPTVTDANISISGGSGTGGAYKIGDTVTAVYDPASQGSELSSVTVDFSQFGGGAAIAAAAGTGANAGKWVATYQIVSGSIDATSRNVSVTATDNAGNSTTTADATNASVDNIAPNVGNTSFTSVSEGSLDTTPNAVTNQATATVVFTYDGNDLGAGEVFQYSTNNSTWTTIPTGSVNTTNNTVSITGLDVAGSPTVYLRALDAAGNTTTLASQVITYDGTAPDAPVISTVTDDVSPVTGTVASGGSTNDTVLVLAGTAEANSTVTLYNGSTSLGTTSADSSGVWSFTTATLTNGTTYTFNATATDAAGNVSAASSNYTVTVDTAAPNAPQLTLGSGVANGVTAVEATAATGVVTLTAESGASVAVVFTGTSGTVTKTVTGNGATAVAVVLDAANLTTLGNGGVSVSATATDAAGNASEAGTGSFTLDTVAPTIAIASNVSTLKAGETAMLTFTLSEASTDFTSADVSVTGGSLSNFAGSGTAYTATFTPTANSTANGVISVASAAFADAAGNTNNDGGDANNTVTLTVDTIRPTIAIASNVSTLKAGETATLTFTLSEASTDFTSADVSVTGGTISNFAGSGTSYTATFTPAANSTANGVISVASDAFADAAGNTNNDGGDANNTVTLTVDTIRPTIAIASNVSTLKAGETATLTFTLSEASTDFTSADINATGGSLSNFAGSGTAYTATFTPTADSTANGVISVASDAFADAAGNTNNDGGDANNTVTLTVDTIRPTIAIASDVSTLKAGETATLTFTLSEASTDFTSADINATGGSLSNFSGSGTSYTATFTPTANSTANGVISVASDAFADAAGNTNNDGGDPNNTVTLTVDTIRPTVTITNSDPNTVNITGTAVTFTFTFSEPVTGFSAASITVSNGTPGTFSSISSTVYTLVVTPNPSSSGNVTVDVAASAATDSAGNGNIAPQQYLQAFDTLAPSVTITDNNSGTAKIGQDITFTFTFSEPVTGFSAAGITVGNGTPGTFSTVSSSVYTLVVTPNSSSSGNVTVDVAASAATDAAGNGNIGPQQYLQGFDTTAPNTPQLSLGYGVANGATFAEATAATGVISLTADTGSSVSVTFTGTSGTVTKTVTGNGATAVAIVLSPSDLNTLGNGNVSVSATATDDAGNTSSAGTVDFTLDTVAPSVAITSIGAGDSIVSSLSNDNTVVGSAEPSRTVSIYSGATLLGTTTADGSGNFAYPLTAANITTLGQGSGKSITASQTDAAGNTGTSSAFPFSVDTLAPTLAINTIFADGYLNDTEDELTQTISGTSTGADGRSVTVNVGGASSTATIANGGAWSIQLTSEQLKAYTEGRITVSANVADQAGNPASQANGSFIVDRTPLAAPVIAASTITGVKATLVITADPGARLNIYSSLDGGPATLLSAAINNLVPSSGRYSFTTPELADGSYSLTVTSIDVAGNESTPSTALPILIAPPATPTVTFTDTGISSNDGITSNGVFSVGNTSGNSWQYSTNGGSTWLNGNSATNSFTLLPGSYGIGQLRVRQVDTNGKQGNSYTNPASITIDVAAPLVSISAIKTILGLVNNGTEAETTTLTFSFSEATNISTAADLSAAVAALVNVSAGTLTPVTPVAVNGNNVTAIYTPPIDFVGSASINVASGRFTDLAGNVNVDGSDTNNTISFSLDTLRASSEPVVSISASSGRLKIGQTATLTFTFTQTPSDFSIGDITASSGSITGLAATSDPKVWTAQYTPAEAAQVTAAISVAAGSFGVNGNAGAGTNKNGASISINVDTLAPAKVDSVAFSADTGLSNVDLITNQANQTVTGTVNGTLSNTVAFSDIVRISIDNGATWRLATVIDTAAGVRRGFSLSNVTLTGSSIIQARVEDDAGNISETYSQSYTYDPITYTGELVLSAYGDGISGNIDSTIRTASGKDNSFSLTLPNKESGANDTYEISTNGGITWRSTTSSQSGLADGTYLYRGSVNDTAGNTATSHVWTVVVDNTPPPSPSITLQRVDGSVNVTALELTSGAGIIRFSAEAGSSVQLAFTSDAAGSTGFTKTVLAGGSSQAVVLSSTEAAMLRGTAAATGKYTVTIDGRAVDAAGNQSASMGTPLTFAYTPNPVIILGELSVAVPDGGDGSEAGPRDSIFRITRSGDTTNAVTVTYLLSGNTVAGTDYNYASGSGYATNGYGSITILAGSSSADVILATIDNITPDPTREIRLTLRSVSGYTISSTAGYDTAVLTDNDAPFVPELSVSDVSVVEGNSGTKVVTFTMKLSQATSAAVSFGYQFRSGTATLGTDFSSSSSNSGTLTIPATGTQITLTAVVSGDTDVESDESFYLDLSQANGVVFKGGTSTLTATATIINDDSSAQVDPNLGVTITSSGDFTGTAKDDILTGDSGINRIDALDGADKITGGLSADLLFSGNGADQFIYSSFSESCLAFGVDTTDASFTNGDRVVLATRPSALWNVGSISSTTATSLAGALGIAMADKDILTPDSQALASGEAVMFTWGPTSRTQRTYLAVADSNTGDNTNDFLILSPLGQNAIGSLSVQSFFA